jgi:Flp pilus assembly protein TadD
MLLGSVLLQQGRLDDSVASFTRAIEISPENISAWTNRGEIHLKQGRLKEAAADLNRASSLDPKGEDPYANRARLLMEMTASMLKVFEENGITAVESARQQILQQLKQT